MGFAAGLGDGFATAFAQGQQNAADEKKMVLSNAFDMIQRNAAIYQQQQHQDVMYKVSARNLVNSLGLPAATWVNAYQLISAGMPIDQAAKQMQMTQFGDAPTAVSDSGVPTATAAPAAGGVDSQMQASGMGGKPPQPTIDPAFQNGQASTGLNANAPAGPTVASTDQSANQPTSPPAIADPSTAPATAPVGGVGAAPTTAINNPNTHPATSSPLADPNAQPENMGMATGSTAVPSSQNPLQAVGDRLALAGKALFDPQARQQLQQEHDQALFDQVKREAAYASGVTPDQIDKYNAGYIPEPVGNAVPVKGFDRMMDPIQAQTALAQAMAPSMKYSQEKADAAQAAQKYYNLAQIVKQNPDVLTAAGPVASAFDTFVQNGDAIAGIADKVFSQGGDSHDLQDALSGLVNQFAPQEGGLANQYKLFTAAVIDAAAARARVMSGGGQVSDNEFLNALKTMIPGHDANTVNTRLRQLAKQDIETADKHNAAFMEEPVMTQFDNSQYGPQFAKVHSPMANDAKYDTLPEFKWTMDDNAPPISRGTSEGTNANATTQSTPTASPNFPPTGHVTDEMIKRYKLDPKTINHPYTYAGNGQLAIE